MAGGAQPMTDKEAKRRGVLYAMEDELWRLVKRRAGYYLAGLAIVGGVGVWLAVELVVQRVAETPLRDLQKEVVRAEVQADAAKRASETARTSAEQVTTTLQNLTEQAKATELQFNLLTEKINAASENANLRSQRDFNALQQRIAALEGLVKKIGEESAASRKATADYAAQVATLAAKVEREQKRFAENSEYTISILFDPSRKALAAEAQSRLAAVGFRATVHEAPAKALKGNTLTYRSESEAKAQEVLSFLKPLVKDVEVKKAAGLVPQKAIDFKFHPSDIATMYSKLGGFDPKNMQLGLGTN